LLTAAPRLLEMVLAGARAPIRVVLRPREAFEELGVLAKKYGIYFTAAFSLGAWIGASMITFFLVLMVTAARSLLSLDIVGLITSPFTAAKIALAFPIIAALVDATLIAVVAAFSPRERPLHAVYVVRASSLLPYSLRAALLALSGNTSIRALVMIGHSTLSLLLLVAGALLTAYGLRRSLGMPPAHALAGAAAPLTYKILLSL